MTRCAPPPALALAPARIAGEVYEVDADDAEGLAHLDDLEFGYAMREIDVVVEGEAAPSRARVYLLEEAETLEALWAGLGDQFEHVPGGDWSALGQ